MNERKTGGGFFACSALLGAIDTANAYASGPEELRIVTLRMDDALALVSLAGEAADLLRGEAEALRECHTLDGTWDGSEPEVQADYERMLDVAARLTPNASLTGVPGFSGTSELKR